MSLSRARKGVAAKQPPFPDTSKELVLSPSKQPTVKLAAVLANMAPAMRRSYLTRGSKKGTPVVYRIKLPYTPTQFSSTVTSGVLSALFGIQESSVSGIADWQTVFAEYRILRAFMKLHFQVQPNAITPAASAGGVAAIEYDSDTSGPASIAEVVQNENAQVFTMQNIYLKPLEFHADLVKGFPEIWVDMGTNDVFASLKMYGSGFGATATPICQVSGWQEMEFRGLA